MCNKIHASHLKICLVALQNERTHAAPDPNYSSFRSLLRGNCRLSPVLQRYSYIHTCLTKRAEALFRRSIFDKKKGKKKRGKNVSAPFVNLP